MPATRSKRSGLAVGLTFFSAARTLASATCSLNTLSSFSKSWSCSCSKPNPRGTRRKPIGRGNHSVLPSFSGVMNESTIGLNMRHYQETRGHTAQRSFRAAPDEMGVHRGIDERRAKACGKCHSSWRKSAWVTWLPTHLACPRRQGKPAGLGHRVLQQNGSGGTFVLSRSRKWCFAYLKHYLYRAW